MFQNQRLGRSVPQGAQGRLAGPLASVTLTQQELTPEFRGGWQDLIELSKIPRVAACGLWATLSCDHSC